MNLEEGGNVIALLKEEARSQGVNQGHLATRVGAERTTINKLFRGHLKRPPFDLVMRIARALRVNLAEPSDGRSVQIGTDVFDPRYDDLKVFGEEINDEIKSYRSFASMNHTMGTQLSTAAVQRKLNLSLFGPMSLTKDGSRLLQFAEKTGAYARKIYLESDPGDPIKVKYLMLEGDFAKFITREEPYDLCSPQEILECIQHLREEGQRRRQFTMYLVNEEKLKKVRDLEFTVKNVETIAVIGENCTMTRQRDRTMAFSRVKHRVQSRTKFLKRLEVLAAPCDLAECEREAEGLVKDYEKHGPRTMPTKEGRRKRCQDLSI